jgi:PAS domain S-box-containing protein
MQPSDYKPVIKISGADPEQIQKLQHWLIDHYNLAESTTPDIEISFPEQGTPDQEFLITAHYFNTGLPTEISAANKHYKIPLSSLNEETLNVILTLIKRKKEEIRKNRDYQYAFMHAQDIILIANCENMIINANPLALQKLGYSRKELFEMNIKQLFYNEEEGREFIKDICEEKEEPHREYKFCTSAHKPFTTLVRTILMNEEEGTFLVVAQDISKQKELEAAKEKQELLAATGKLAAIIAHEVRNPLYNIVLAAELLSDADQEEQNGREIIQRNCKRIDNLIRQLLEPGQWGTLNTELISVAALVEDTIRQVSDRLTLKGIQVSHQIDPNFFLSLDKEKIKTAFTNLIINAAEAIEHDKGLITITTGFENGRFVIQIGDNGKGLSEHIQREIFSPYFTTKSHGLGLGLVNTSQIIKAHNGTIRFTSGEREGTLFTISLPLQAAHQNNNPGLS